MSCLVNCVVSKEGGTFSGMGDTEIYKGIHSSEIEHAMQEYDRQRAQLYYQNDGWGSFLPISVELLRSSAVFIAEMF